MNQGIGQPDDSADTGGYSFTLEDEQGREHSYHVGKKHPPMPRSGGPSGLRMLNYIAEAAGTPIAELLQTNAGQLMELYLQRARNGQAPDGEDLEGVLDMELEELDSLDLEATTALEKLTETLDAIDPVELFEKLFFYTNRDGDSLRKRQNFNQAYAGNYSEMIRAAYEICQYNGFFGQLGTFLEKHAGPT